MKTIYFDFVEYFSIKLQQNWLGGGYAEHC